MTEQRIEYIRRMQEGMRAMTADVIAAVLQANNISSLQNCATSNGDAALNMWPEIVDTKPDNQPSRLAISAAAGLK